MVKKLLVCAVMAIASFAIVASAYATPVGLELALLVDVSGSVDATEFALQRTGYVNAFNSLYNNIPNAGTIAATLVYWSGAGQQQQALPWTLITNDATSEAFATAINATTRPFSGLTAPGSAIDFAVNIFNNSYEGTRRVIDVSGDGSQNDGANTATARNNAVGAGFVINGLPILGSEANLATWYQNNIVGGTGSFMITASDFASFGTAISQKIEREIIGDGIPEPGSMSLLGLGLLGLARRFRRK